MKRIRARTGSSQSPIDLIAPLAQLLKSKAKTPLIDAFAERHEPIKEFFYSSIGSQQHRLDSEIATNVIAYYLYGINRHRENLRREGKDPKQKVPNPQLVLCIHDSFIIRADWHQSLEDVMEQAYINHLQLNPLKEVKTKKEKIEFSKTTAIKLKKPIRGWAPGQSIILSKKNRKN